MVRPGYENFPFRFGSRPASAATPLHTPILKGYWSERLDLNQRSLRPKRSAIPNFATPRFLHIHYTIILTKSQIIKRPVGVEPTNKDFADPLPADENWTRQWLI